MELLDTEIREKIIEIAKKHKASWIELGQYLQAAYKDKLFKTWGYLSFEVYCHKELGIKQATASKLVKSYGFLEKEEPRYLREELSGDVKPGAVPDFQSVNLLRLAKMNKNIDSEGYQTIRKTVLEGCKEPKEVKAVIQKHITVDESKEPEDIKRDQRNTAIKRLLTFLGRTRKELSDQKLIPAYLIKQIEDLENKLGDQLDS